MPSSKYSKNPISPSASFGLTLRIELERGPATLNKVTAAIASAGGNVSAVDTVKSSAGAKVRDIYVDARDQDHWDEILDAVKGTEGARLVDWTDRTFQLHIGGKVRIQNKISLKTRDDLSMAYTPGVARVCEAIADDPEKAFQYTIKRNTVAIVSDGTAVLGLGDIGPEAAMPVMEGKAMLFKEFAKIDAIPLCLGTKDTDEIVQIVKAISPTFGGINLEDISSPRCFEIEQRLIEKLDIPVFHDDQHGTAVVVLASLFNSLKIVGKKIEDLNVLVVGLGAAGVAVTKMLLESGVTKIIGCDRKGAIHREREDWESMNELKRWYAQATNLDLRSGRPEDVIEGADLFIGLSGPGVIAPKALERMANDAIVFAMANPVPEVMPEEADPYVRIMATGRSDYPNQINNVLCFPGIFRGALDSHACAITEGMKIEAAHGLAGVVDEDELDEDYIIPSVFNRDVVSAVADAVAKEAEREGIGRKADESEMGYAAIDEL